MWIPKSLLNLLGVNADLMKQLQNDNVALRSERDTLKTHLAVTQTNFDWLRMKVNTLEYERVALLEKCYGIKTPAPSIERKVEIDPSLDTRQFSFDDIGDDMARKLGLPIWGEQ